MNMPLVLLNRRRRGNVFSPSTLFALAEPGVWYDPSDLTTLFTDTAGTQPVTTPGQTVALALDKSKGAVGTNGGGRKNLLIRTEEFNDAAWTKSEATVTANSGSAPDGTNTADKLIPTVTNASHYARQVSTVTNTTHTYTVYAKADGYNFVTLQLANSGTYGKYFEGVFNLSTGAVEATGRSVTYTGSRSITALASGWYRCQITVNNIDANSTTISVVLPQATNDPTVTYSGNGTSGILIWGAQLEVNSVATSYQRITSDWPATMPGFHATQATLASRPTYGIVPLGGRRNLLTRTEEFNDAVWVKGSATSITSTSQIDPLGTSTAETVTFSNTSADANIWQSATVVANTNYVLSFYLKSGTANDVSVVARTAAWATNISFQSFSLTSGWVRYQLAFNSGANTTISLGLRGSTTTAGTILIWGAQLETGSSATAYQRVGSAFDVTEAGVASLSYLSFDGVDDFMVTPTITPGIDKAQVFAGVRKLTDPSFAVIAETSTIFNTNAGCLLLFTNPGLNGFVSRGSASGPTSATISATAPVTSVLTGLGDIAADVSNVRQNGIAGAAGTGDQGTGNYLAYPMYIGRRGNGLNAINMNLFSLIVRFGANLDANTITNTETWVNGKTGAY